MCDLYQTYRRSIDPLQRVDAGMEMTDLNAMVDHAKHDSARRFNEHFGFVQSPTDKLLLYLLPKDLRQFAIAWDMR